MEIEEEIIKSSLGHLQISLSSTSGGSLADRKEIPATTTSGKRDHEVTGMTIRFPENKVGSLAVDGQLLKEKERKIRS